MLLARLTTPPPRPAVAIEVPDLRPFRGARPAAERDGRVRRGRQRERRASRPVAKLYLSAWPSRTNTRSAASARRPSPAPSSLVTAGERQRLVFGPCLTGEPDVESGRLVAFAEHERAARMLCPRRAGRRCRPALGESSAICMAAPALADHHVLHVGHVGFVGKLAHVDEAHRHGQWAR